MMKLENQVCTFEQAKKLKELGVSSRSKFVIALQEDGETGTYCFVINNGIPVSVYDGTNKSLYKTIPVYTVAELGAMLPDTYNRIFNGASMAQITSCRHFSEKTYCLFVEELVNTDETFLIDVRKDTEAEARAAMLIYLLEKNITTVEEVNNRLNS